MPQPSRLLHYQICIGSTKGFADFLDVMRSFADARHLVFKDTSAETIKNFENLKRQGVDPLGNTVGPIITINMVDQSGAQVMRGLNMGLPGYQLTLIFYRPLDPPRIQALTDELVGILEKRWRILPYNPHSGVLPIKDCEE